MLKCPFCHIPMFPKEANLLYCAAHKFTVNMSTREAQFGADAAEEYHESVKFLKRFFKEQYMFALSSIELFKEGFKDENVKVVALGSTRKLPTPSDVSKGHLIAGAGLVAHNLLRKMCVAHEKLLEACPLSVTFNTASDYLFDLTMFENMNCSYKVKKSLYSYLMPTPDAMASALTDFPYVGIKPMRDEDVLYSAIFMQPQNLIRWEPSRLRKVVRAFILAVTDFVPDSKEQLPFVFEENFQKFPKALTEREDGKNLYNLALKGNPATAANEGASAFDILNLSYLKVEGPGSKMTSNELMTFMSLYRLLEALFNKYAAPFTPMGIKMKESCLKYNIEKTDHDTVVFEYWKMINRELKKEV